MARYLLDIFLSPPVVVLIVSEGAELLDPGALERVGQRYADQVGRPLVITSGPDPIDAQVRPTVPHVEPLAVVGSQDPRLVAPVNVAVFPLLPSEDETLRTGFDERLRATGALLPLEASRRNVSVSYNPDRLTENQRSVLEGLGVKL